MKKVISLMLSLMLMLSISAFPMAFAAEGTGTDGTTTDTTPQPTQFTVFVETDGHGTVTVNPGRPNEGDRVDVSVTPAIGYELDTIKVTDAKNAEVTTSATPQGVWFTAPAGNVLVTVTFKASALKFADVAPDAPYYQSVAYLNQKGYVNGTSDTTYSPDLVMTRAQLVTILYNATGAPTAEGELKFTDVKEDAYYANAVKWAVAHGVVSGYSETTFGPDDTLTREQIILLMFHYLQMMARDVRPAEGACSGFADAASISNWALDGMTWAVNVGILSGDKDNNLGPQASITRGEMAIIFAKVCEYYYV